MSGHDLTTDIGLRAAIEEAKRSGLSDARRASWLPRLAATIAWVRQSDETARATFEFQQRLWEENNVAAVGQGNIAVDDALADAEFRTWLAQESMKPLPARTADRTNFLESMYQGIVEKIRPFLGKQKTPKLKILRVITALFPEAMTTVASTKHLRRLVVAMGGDRQNTPIGHHLWVRRRLDAALGPLVSSDADALADRISLPWLLLKLFVDGEADDADEAEDGQLEPLPAVKRRRGLTPIRGLFQSTLAILEFARAGVSRDQLLDHLRTEMPEVRETGLGVVINVLASELGAIQKNGDEYVLTTAGFEALRQSSADPLSDWLLTRVLGVDHALVALADQGVMSPTDLTKTIQAANPGWTTLFVPQAIVSWLRSMGVIETNDAWKYELAAMGQVWRKRIHWTPESLPKQTSPVTLESGPTQKLALPSLVEISKVVRSKGSFSHELVAKLHFGLWSRERRHFAILTGLSGSGKTMLAREYANALYKTVDDAKLRTIPVQPGWTDPSPLLGYVNPLRDETFVQTEFLDFLLSAAGDPGKPYVAVLDEMNLSHPEQYMAPLLSAMETGDPIKLHQEGSGLGGVPDQIAYPQNLAIIGTVNMDETTHGLSDKVLDRAFVLEFWDVTLDEYPKWGKRKILPESEGQVRQALTELMTALSPARLHFGWRTVDDVLDFVAMTETDGAGLSITAALDCIVSAKILPKLRGEDSPRFRKALDGCAAVAAKYQLLEAAKKLAELTDDVKTTGSARYWR